MKEVGASSQFEVDTKIKGFSDMSLTRDAILRSAKQSLEDLGLDSVSPFAMVYSLI